MPGDSSWAPPLFARPFRPHPLDTWATESEATQTSSPIIPSHIQRKADEEHEGIDDERESENGEEPQVTKAEDAPETAEGDNKWIPKVNKKSTVDQLREALEQMGLNTKGKKETLLRRAQNAIHAANLSVALDSQASTPSGDEDNPWDCGDFPPDSVLAAHFAAKEKRRQEREEMKILGQRYRSFLCFDVEATCRGGKEFDYPNEIIEFPVVLVRWGEPNEEGKRVLEKIDSFRSYVRPTWRPVLTDFCKSLTGIQQETVDKSPIFPEVLKQLEEWLDKWDLRGDKGLKDALWVTDGPWDLRDFVPKQLHITPPNPFPNYFHGPYLNIKHAVQSVMSEINRRRVYAAAHPDNAANERATQPITTSRRAGKWRPGQGAGPLGSVSRRGPREATPPPLQGVTSPATETVDSAPPPTPPRTFVRKEGDYYLNIAGMCEALGLGEFEGRQHSGLDDATNISRILIALSRWNVIFEPNGVIQPMGSGKRYPWMGESGKVVWEEWMSSQRPQDDPAKRESEEKKKQEDSKTQNAPAEEFELSIAAGDAAIKDPADGTAEHWEEGCGYCKENTVS
ncbi:hypothetical protein, variant [Cryptococcus neoformans var. grubii H99]|uniref:SAP domain-containing protein n=1 Tax=Cryptococcus neoformans (strain H99 / ATCC 208821 / CBS 10515 / FGSC 9487) TaxID=235443 RepID=T2BMK1_CRYN9|nr:hypothetical protein, variant [Cryptococcus neoformans var. grubii H99]AGV14410.1 hypothetical protein, variant [Cryptococcus neoformans var. grubii H99]AUB25269.1 hypothetical protein CKF44_02368 [Cryptococcus neoformans var. grubii]|eukprot:XP_012050109.1 hypothetical protein, variant [Cryptococcus neoformans var. grubii H99]